MQILNKNVATTVYEPLYYQPLQLADIKLLFQNCQFTGDENLQNIIPFSERCRNYFNSLPTPVNEGFFQNGHPCISISGDDLPKLMLLEAYDFFLKAITNFFAQYELIQKGFVTWSKISNYYSSFFAINSLLRLQGRMISRIWNKIPFYIFINIQANEFYINIRRQGSNHENLWYIFYNTYDKFQFLDTRFEPAYKKNFLDYNHADETEYRNSINYKVYVGFREFWDVTQITSIIENYEHFNTFQNDLINQLFALSTDPDFKYYSRAALRILLLLNIFREISVANTFHDNIIKTSIEKFSQIYIKNSLQENKITTHLYNFVLN